MIYNETANSRKTKLFGHLIRHSELLEMTPQNGRFWAKELEEDLEQQLFSLSHAN